MSGIQWNCTVCGKEIADSVGWLTVGTPAVVEAEKANQGYDRRFQNHRPHFPRIRVHNILPLPAKAAWVAYHHECDPAHDAALYSIGVENLRTIQDLLHWTLHFLDTKSWIAHTTWSELVRSKMPACKA